MKDNGTAGKKSSKMTPSHTNILLVLLILSGFDSVDDHFIQETCHKGCQCDGILMTCEGTIPREIPRSVTKVELVDFDETLLADGVFCNSCWEQIL